MYVCYRVGREGEHATRVLLVLRVLGVLLTTVPTLSAVTTTRSGSVYAVVLLTACTVLYTYVGVCYA